MNAAEEESAEVVAAGVIRIHLLDFLRQLTFCVEAPTPQAAATSLARFGQFFPARALRRFTRGASSPRPPSNSGPVVGRGARPAPRPLPPLSAEGTVALQVARRPNRCCQSAQRRGNG